MSQAVRGFQQRLGPFDATMLVAGSMIGSGIFIVSADISREVGSAGWLLVAWILTGVITVAGALSYAELAGMMPHAGGQYVYLRQAYGPLWGFLYGWTLFLVIQTGTIAAVGVAFAKFLGVLIPELGADPTAGALVLFNLGSFTVTAGQCVAVAVVILLTAVNCLGVREGKWVQNLFTVAKTGALALLVILGLTVAVNPDAIAINTRDWWGGMVETPTFARAHSFLPISGIATMMVLGAAMVGSLFSADAWNNVTFIAGEIRNPRRTLPLCLFLGTSMVILLYVLANVAYVLDLPVMGTPELASELKSAQARIAELRAAGDTAGVEAATKALDSRLESASTFERGIARARDDRVGTAVMQVVASTGGASIMAVAIMLSTFGCANGLILAGARLYYAMAADGLFFRGVGKLNRFGVPAAGLVLQAIWASLLTFSGTYSQLLDYVIFANLLFYMLTVVGLFVLRRRQPDADRPYRAFGYPVVPGFYALCCAAIMIDLLVMKPVYTWPGLIIVLLGIPVYFAWRRRSARVSVA